MALGIRKSGSFSSSSLSKVMVSMVLFAFSGEAGPLALLGPARSCGSCCSSSEEDELDVDDWEDDAAGGTKAEFDVVESASISGIPGSGKSSFSSSVSAGRLKPHPTPKREDSRDEETVGDEIGELSPPPPPGMSDIAEDRYKGSGSRDQGEQNLAKI